MTNKLADFKPLEHNPNQHTLRGLKALEESIREDGYTEPMVASADQTILSGNARQERAVDIFGPNVEPIIVESDGTRPIIHIRTDIPDAESDVAKRVIIRANRVAEIDLQWNPEVLVGMGSPVINSLWEKDEMDDLGDKWEFNQEPSNGELLKLVNVTIEEPKHKTQKGEVWRVGESILVVDEVISGWERWKKYLKGKDLLFCPYPGPFIPLSVKANHYRLLMVQPDPYIAGHILDRYTEINGEESVRCEQN